MLLPLPPPPNPPLRFEGSPPGSRRYAPELAVLPLLRLASASATSELSRLNGLFAAALHGSRLKSVVKYRRVKRARESSIGIGSMDGCEDLATLLG
jgi:hypothetical protein